MATGQTQAYLVRWGWRDKATSRQHVETRVCTNVDDVLGEVRDALLRGGARASVYVGFADITYTYPDEWDDDTAA